MQELKINKTIREIFNERAEALFYKHRVNLKKESTFMEEKEKTISITPKEEEEANVTS